MKWTKAKCGCGTIYVADSTHHSMDYCPKCKESAVDLEEYMCRYVGEVKIVESFDAPWFDDEEDYHSCLLGWLNDSDEEYELSKPDDVLLVEKKNGTKKH